MKKKTINRTIRKKMNEWIKTIKDKELRESLKSEVIVTGGSIVSMLLREKIRDFDVYIETSETCKKIAEYYLNKAGISEAVRIVDDRVQIALKNRDGFFKKSASDYDEKDTYVPLFFTENSITLSDSVQIVTRFTGDPSEIHSNYDFVHATNYWTYKAGLVFNTDALVSILTKELRYTGSKYPLCSIIRSKKFIERGWTINAGQYLKMCMQLNDLDLRDMEVLKDQIIGVDVAYFHNLLYNMDQEGIDLKEVDQRHIMKIIGQVFDDEDIPDFLNENLQESEEE